MSLGHPLAYTVGMETAHTSKARNAIACCKVFHADDALPTDQG